MNLHAGVCPSVSFNPCRYYRDPVFTARIPPQGSDCPSEMEWNAHQQSRTKCRSEEMQQKKRDKAKIDKDGPFTSRPGLGRAAHQPKTNPPLQLIPRTHGCACNGRLDKHSWEALGPFAGGGMRPYTG